MSEIIGAGLCRTGTSSSLVALERLELGPVYHMKEVMARNLADKWMDYIDGNKEPILKHFDEIGYKSSLDLPIICIFEELMLRYPNAKVLLTLRDTPEAWVKSFRSTIWQMLNMPAWTGINVIMGGLIGTFAGIEKKKKFFGFMFGTICEKGNSVSDKKVTWSLDITDEELATMYSNWTKYVRTVVPKEKFLEFNVKDGVKKLSDFAGKKTPEWPMPYVNDSSEFLRRRKMIMGLSLFLYLLLGMSIIGMIKHNTMIVIIPLGIIVTLQCLSTVILDYAVRQTLNNDRNKKLE